MTLLEGSCVNICKMASTTVIVLPVPGKKLCISLKSPVPLASICTRNQISANFCTKYSHILILLHSERPKLYTIVYNFGLSECNRVK